MKLFETFIFQNLTEEEFEDMNRLRFLRTASYDSIMKRPGTSR